MIALTNVSFGSRHAVSMFAVDTLGGLVAGDAVAVIDPEPIGLTAAQILKGLNPSL